MVMKTDLQCTARGHERPSDKFKGKEAVTKSPHCCLKRTPLPLVRTQPTPAPASQRLVLSSQAVASGVDGTPIAAAAAAS